ncbi:late competence protein ComER [Paenibacillus glycanilyticus]|uniref:late competence protein ComER n=1 Tax=Paenibacillus glycanilyticus TaxID=126569 RepID=UPI0020422C45|nr:late competence protein ComER [Paenibacillus glycanilyticus]MCM3627236.1 late competence protein ComER [Paenibacillus glycanilyticus]
MNVGFIGTGAMGSLLIEAFVASGALDPCHIVISNRTYSKAQALADRYPGMRAERSNASTASATDILFLCVKPHEYKKVIDELKPVLRPEQLLISITSPVMIEHLEELVPCKIAKVIPSVTNLVWSGATLCIYGSRITEEDQGMIEGLLAYISEPLRIEEPYTRIVSDLSSCGPAFFAYLIEQFVDAAVCETGIAREDAVKVASTMLLGTGLLLTEGGLSPEDVQKRVAVPGGITAQALQLLNRELDGTFNRLIRTTHKKFDDDVAKITADFYSKEVNGQ